MCACTHAPSLVILRRRACACAWKGAEEAVTKNGRRGVGRGRLTRGSRRRVGGKRRGPPLPGSLAGSQGGVEILEGEGVEGGEAGENRSDGRAARRSDVVEPVKQGTEIKNRRGSGQIFCVRPIISFNRYYLYL